MKSDEIQILIKYRLEQAQTALDDAKYMIDGNRSPQSIVNRSYYAMFYAVLALLVIEKKETSKHSGVISLFDKEFVKRAVIAKDFSRWLHDAFDLRQRSDYSAEFEISYQEVDEMLQHAKDFVKEIKDVLQKKNLCDAF